MRLYDYTSSFCTSQNYRIVNIIICNHNCIKIKKKTYRNLIVSIRKKNKKKRCLLLII